VKVSYSKGVATHADPESCVRMGNRAGEALTGARAGQVLSRESKNNLREADGVVVPEGNMESFVTRENDFAPAWSLDPVHVRKLLTREPGDPVSGLGCGSKSAL
jgi:hypothetical protein